MGQKINAISLRLQKTNRRYQSQFFSKIYYTQLFLCDFSLRNHGKTLLNQWGYTEPLIFSSFYNRKNTKWLFFNIGEIVEKLKKKRPPLKKTNSLKKKQFINLLLSFYRYKQKKRNSFYYDAAKPNKYSFLLELQEKRLNNFYSIQNEFSLHLKNSRFLWYWPVANPNTIFSSIKTQKQKDTYIVENRYNESHIFRKYFSYRIDSQNNIMKYQNKDVKDKYIQISDFRQNTQYICDLLVYYIKKRVPYRKLCSRTLKELRKMPYIAGVRLTYSGRLGGKTNKAIRKKVETVQFGQPSLHIFSSKIDYMRAEAATKFGMAGIKLWIRYR